MNRSPILVSLLSFIAINVGMDVVAGIALLSEDGPETLLFLFAGLLWGQFGLCCGTRLRFPELQLYANIGMLLVPAIGVPFLWPSLMFREPSQLIAMAMLAVGFTALFCMGPRSLIDWPGLGNRFTLQQMLVGTVFVAFACVIFMHLPIVLPIGFAILIMSLPSVIASNLLAKVEGMVGYSWMMIAGLIICFLFIAIEPQAAIGFGFFIAQIMVLWVGGLMLISIGQGSARQEVVGLPEE